MSIMAVGRPNGKGAVAGSRRLGLLALVLVSVFSEGCTTRGLSFVRDDRVAIIEPSDGESVRLPFTLRWTAEGFDGTYVVLFDRSPMRPNRSLLSFVPESDPCRTESTCPDEEWLAERDIYVVGETHLVVDHLPDRRENNRSKDRHDVTIVLLDEHGRRLGESAFTREFTLERED